MITPLPQGLSIHGVTLVARDAGRLAEFYIKELGLVEHGRSGRAITIGSSEGSPFLFIEDDETASMRPLGAPGLFHVAYLFSDRRKLAQVLRRVADRRVPLEGFSDHLVSEAIYLSDPEGNGIELYRDRPRNEWPLDGGKIKMATEPLDVDGLLAEPPVDDEEMRRGLRIGHVHLQTSDLHSAEAFWVARVGFDVVTRDYPGALFVSAGGYHHHLGLNVWRSRGRTLPPGRWTGLSAVDITVPRSSDVIPVAERFGVPAAQSVSAVFEGTTVSISSR